MTIRLNQTGWRMLPLIFTAWLLIGSAGAAELPKVVILATGGTIAGEQKKPGEAGYVAGQLAVERGVSASTQNQAKAALLFLYREVLQVALPWLDDLVAA